MPTKFLYFDLGKVILEFSHERMCAQMAEAAGTTVENVRSFVLGDLHWTLLANAAYLAAMGTIGLRIAVRRLGGLLLP